MKLREIFTKPDSKSGRILDFIIQAFIIISLVSFTIETIPNLSSEYLKWLNYLEVITVAIFTIEYLMRLYFVENKLKFIFSFYGIIDLLAIMPFYVTRTVDLRSIRVFRLLRLFRAFKLLRYSRAIKTLKSAFYLIKEELIIFLTTTVLLIYFASVGIYYFENSAQPEKFGSVFDCMWWAVATLTTVGYGDVYPITTGGRIFTSFIVLLGLGIVAVPTGLIASALTRSLSEEKIQATKEYEEKIPYN